MMDEPAKILIVDDDEINRRLFKTILDAEGYKTLQAADGKSALDVAKQESPDLIILDIQMPVMDGITAFSLLKSEPSSNSIPVVALTSYAMEGERKKLLSLGFTEHIPKPIELRKFTEVIKNLIG
jgi:two-component system cell cycle response regulator DivK